MRTDSDDLAEAARVRGREASAWDEDDDTSANHVPTFIIGTPVKQPRHDRSLNHFSLLRKIEEMYRLPLTGAAAAARPITRIWEAPAATPRALIYATP